jgi:RNA polymerase-binding transcription factor DksA
MEETTGRDPVDPADPALSAGFDPAAGGITAELDAVEEELSGVELALVRLDQGSYGRCELCGAEIDASLLADVPTVRHCRSHLPLPLS